MALFGLSVKETYKLLLMVAIATLAFGLVGFVLISLMQLVSMQGFATDSVHKHGIAEMQASRLGGAATIFGGVIVLIVLALNGRQADCSGRLLVDALPWFSFMCSMLLGLVAAI